MAELKPETDPLPPVSAATEAAHLRDLSPQQWKSGIAAWLGWLFDGLDMHIYVLVAAPFVTELLGAASPKDPAVGFYSSWIQAAFLIGWALGGGFFGRVSDRIGRSRALTLTILTYALATGLSYFATTWWQLLVFRFLAALGIGGEWAVGASLLSETWPRRWRPWIAAVLQTAVNLGVMLAALAVFLMADLPPRCVFLIGVLPAFLVLWIRRAVPEPEEWHAAKLHTSARDEPRFLDLFLAPIRRTTLLTLSICACALTAHWAFLFWFSQQLRNLPELNDWSDGDKSRLVGVTMLVLVAVSIVGNFAAAWLARRLTYRSAIAILCLVYWASMAWTYAVPRGATNCGSATSWSACVRACSDSSRCTCRRSFRRCCAPRARAFAITSAGSWPGSARSCSDSMRAGSDSSPRPATTAWRSSLRVSCSFPPPSSRTSCP